MRRGQGWPGRRAGAVVLQRHETGKRLPPFRAFCPCAPWSGGVNLSPKPGDPRGIFSWECIEHFGILVGWRMELRGQTWARGWGPDRKQLSGLGQEEEVAADCVWE